MEDLWPDFKDFAPFKTPISIIKDQASKLENKTNYLVSAEVEQDDVLVNFIDSSHRPYHVTDICGTCGNQYRFP